MIYKVTIAICTYNRDFFLEKCLESLYKYGAVDIRVEVMVIDNNSTDKTAEISKQYLEKYSNFKYIFEPKAGLSYARNIAYLHAQAPYVAYLDDDVIISESYIDRLLWLVENVDFDCAGGIYSPWYIKEKPKWFPDKFGSKQKLTDSLSKVDNEDMPGLNIIFKKKILDQIGGFPIEFGMREKKIYYGEENYVQKRIRDLNGSIYFDPDLHVFHAVQEYKLSVLWQLKSSYLNAKTGYLINKNESLMFILFQLVKSIVKILIVRLPVNLYKYIFYKNYYYQNFIYDTFWAFTINIGKLSGYLSSVKNFYLRK